MSHLSWTDRSLALLHDAARCLALVHQGRVHLNRDGGLSKNSLATLAQQTGLAPAASAPRKEQAASYHSFLFRLLGHAGLIGAAGKTVLLSAAAYQWLDQPPELQLQQLRQTWWLASDVGWYWSTTVTRQRRLDSRWRTITLEVVKSVAELPTATWIPVSELVTDLGQRGVLASNSVSCNLPRVRHSVAQRTHNILRFTLLEILPCLGLVETHSQEAAVLLRPTSEGSSWLRTALAQHRHMIHPPSDAAVEACVPSHELRFPRPEDPPVTIQDDLILTVHQAAPAACTFEIAHFARWLTPQALRPGSGQAPARYQITLATLQHALAWEYRVADVIFLLNRFTAGRVPPVALAQLSTWQQEMTTITYEPGYCLRTADPAILGALRRRAPFRRRTRTSSGHEAWVSHTQAGAVFRYLRRLGYVLVLSEAADAVSDDERASWPLRHSALPLPQLLTALRTYQHLRHVAPGLADLGLQDLMREIEAALSPDDLAAVQRLLESHAELLAQALTQQEDEGTREQVGTEIAEQADQAGEDDDDVPLPSTPGPLVSPSALQAAIETGAPLQITYVDTLGRVTRRRVHPLRLEHRWGQHYLVARCELRQEERHFRLDRIVELEIER